MSFKGYIGVWKVLAAGASGAGISLGLVGVIESQYYSPGSFAALMFGFGLYALAGVVWGVVVALLFGGKARNNREDLVRMAGWLAAVPTAVLIATAGAYSVYCDLWNESVAQAGLVGWLVMLAVPLLAVAGAWFARVLGRSLAVSPLVAPVLVLPLALAGTLLAGWIEEPPVPSLDLSGRTADESRPAVILVVADGLRADVTGPYGRTSCTPNLDAFAKDAVVFEQAWASSSWTRPSVASILTGRYPAGHRVKAKTDRLPAEIPTLAGKLKESGYVTLASVTGLNLAPATGIARGFDSYAYFPPRPFLGAPESASRLFLMEVYRLVRLGLDPGHREVSRYYAAGERILRQGRALMAQAVQAPVPFFAYLHFMEPHEPFFAHPYDGRALAREEDPNPAKERAGEYLDLYRQEAGHWDGLFGELVVYLKEAGCYHNSLIMVTADHGQEFADHQGFWHGSSLYQEQIHVPLLIRFPGGAGAGTVQDRPVSLVDLLPTVLQTLDIQPPGLPGQSLNTHTTSGQPRTLFAELDAQGCVMTAVRDSRFKLIHAKADSVCKTPGTQLFDLVADPRELDDLAGKDPSTVALLKQIMEKGSAGPPEKKPVGAQVDPETEEQLRSLGYTE